MSQKQTLKIINKIWSAIVVFLLLYSFNTLAVVQWGMSNGLVAFPLQIFSNNTVTRDTVLYIGIPVIMLLILVVLYLSNVYYDNSIGNKWNQRVPIFLDLDIDMSQSGLTGNKFLNKWSQLSFLALIMPYLINLQQLYKFFREPNKAFYIDSESTVSIFHLTSPLVIFTDQYRYGDAHGWTFFPLYIPIVFIILELVVLFCFYKYFKRVFNI